MKIPGLRIIDLVEIWGETLGNAGIMPRIYVDSRAKIEVIEGHLFIEEPPPDTTNLKIEIGDP